MTDDRFTCQHSDVTHCECWYDNDPCCFCGDNEFTDEDLSNILGNLLM